MKKYHNLIYDDVHKGDQINTWISDTMLYIAERAKFKEEHINQFVLTLFRYLGVRHRVLYPMSGEDYIVNPQIMKQLNRAICESAMKFFYDKSAPLDQFKQKVLID